MRNVLKFKEDSFGVRYLVLGSTTYYATADLKGGNGIKSKRQSDKWQESKFSVYLFQNPRNYIKAPVFSLSYRGLKLVTKTDIKDAILTYKQKHGELCINADTLNWLRSIDLHIDGLKVTNPHNNSKKQGKEAAWRGINKSRIKYYAKRITEGKEIV